MFWVFFGGMCVRINDSICHFLSPHLHNAGLGKGDRILKMQFCVSPYLFAGFLFGMP